MTAWLLSVVGITVIGVLIELVLTDSPISKFVRSIYAFFILFIIIQPLPKLFAGGKSIFETGDSFANASLTNEITAQIGDATAQRVTEALKTAGYDCIVTFFDGKYYVNAYNSAKKDTDTIIQIVTAIANVNSDAVEVFI